MGFFAYRRIGAGAYFGTSTGALLEQAVQSLNDSLAADLVQTIKECSPFDSKIILINGHKLAAFMIEHNVGISPAMTYVVKRIDTDYFTDE